MMKISAALLVFLVAAASVAADYPGLVEEPKTPQARALKSAGENHLDVPYLGDWRDTLTHGGWPNTFLAYRARMNIYVPPGDGPFPCFIYVHGGGYGEGHATSFGVWNEKAVDGRNTDSRKLGMERGYVLVAMNYILKGPHVQVQRDFKEGIRFLRANAAKYKIDPNRVAAIGASAGGWLITSGGLTTADDYGYDSKGSMPLSSWPDGAEWKRALKMTRRKKPTILMSSFDEMEPRHPEISSRLNALTFDFCHQLQSTTPDDPLMLSLAGSPEAWWQRMGARAGDRQDLLRKKLTLMDFGKLNAKELTKKGKLPGTLHVPASNMLVPGLDGGEPVTAVEFVYNWLDKNLRGNDARTPTPEARPNRRIFMDKVQVTFAVAAPGTRVHYTLDGSEPTTDSPTTGKPLTLSETTTIKFIAVADGMQPSFVASARFIKGDPLPRVTAPSEPVLPIATVGKPYEVTFKTDRAAVWYFRLACVNNWKDGAFKKKGKEGHKELSDLQARVGNLYQIGLGCEPACTVKSAAEGATTARIVGTPNRAGTFPLQVLTALDRNGPADCHTYNLVVLPDGTAK